MKMIKIPLLSNIFLHPHPPRAGVFFLLILHSAYETMRLDRIAVPAHLFSEKARGPPNRLRL
jgi:hypothetical protein